MLVARLPWVADTLGSSLTGMGTWGASAAWSFGPFTKCSWRSMTSMNEMQTTWLTSLSLYLTLYQKSGPQLPNCISTHGLMQDLYDVSHACHLLIKASHWMMAFPRSRGKRKMKGKKWQWDWGILLLMELQSQPKIVKQEVNQARQMLQPLGR